MGRRTRAGGRRTGSSLLMDWLTYLAVGAVVCLLVRRHLRTSRVRFSTLDAMCALYRMHPRLAARTRLVASPSVPSSLHGAVMDDDTVEVYSRSFRRGGSTVLLTALHEWSHFTPAGAVDARHDGRFRIALQRWLGRASEALGVSPPPRGRSFRQDEAAAIAAFSSATGKRRRLTWHRRGTIHSSSTRGTA